MRGLRARAYEDDSLLSSSGARAEKLVRRRPDAVADFRLHRNDSRARVLFRRTKHDRVTYKADFFSVRRTDRSADDVRD